MSAARPWHKVRTPYEINVPLLIKSFSTQTVKQERKCYLGVLSLKWIKETELFPAQQKISHVFVADPLPHIIFGQVLIDLKSIMGFPFLLLGISVSMTMWLSARTPATHPRHSQMRKGTYLSSNVQRQGMVKGNQQREHPRPSWWPETITIPKLEGMWEGVVISPLTEILEHHCCQHTALQGCRQGSKYPTALPTRLNFLLTPPIGQPRLEDRR